MSLRAGLEAELDVGLRADVGILVEACRAKRQIEAAGAIGSKRHAADLVRHRAAQQASRVARLRTRAGLGGAHDGARESARLLSPHHTKKMSELFWLGKRLALIF